jgi:hypothetical protein
MYRSLDHIDNLLKVQFADPWDTTINTLLKVQISVTPDIDPWVNQHTVDILLQIQIQG